MNKLSRILVLAMILVSMGVFEPARPARAAATWTKGLYVGWVYFLAKADMQYRQAAQGVSVQVDGVRYYESHGDLECTVFDEDGNGHCGANFPMDITWGESGTAVLPNCTVTITGSSRADAVNGGPPLAPLTSAPLAQGFSVGFFPQIGPENGSLTAVGCPGGGTNSYSIDAGQPVWPKLDFHVEHHTALSMGGSCSMEGLPRSITVGAMSSSLTLQECEWRVLFIDPYATLPEE